MQIDVILWRYFLYVDVALYVQLIRCRVCLDLVQFATLIVTDTVVPRRSVCHI